MAGHPGLRAPLRGRVQQELARRRLRGRQARRRARRRVPRDRRRRRRPHRRPRAARSAPTARRRSSAPRAPEGLAQPVVDAMAKVIDDNGHDYALFGGGLLGFEIGAGLAARLNAGVTMEVTEVSVEDGKLVAERPILGDSSISTSRYKRPRASSSAASTRSRSRESGGGAAAVEDVDGRALGTARRKATMVQRGEQRGADVDIEGADILVAGGRGLGKAEGFELLEELAERARRRRRRDPRGGRRRLVPVRRADRPDGQDRRAEALPRGRHLRRDPAQGRHAVLGEHRRDQQGRERPDLRVLRPRHRRRPQQDPARSSPRP